MWQDWSDYEDPMTVPAAEVYDDVGEKCGSVTEKDVLAFTGGLAEVDRAIKAQSSSGASITLVLQQTRIVVVLIVPMVMLGMILAFFQASFIFAACTYVPLAAGFIMTTRHLSEDQAPTSSQLRLADASRLLKQQ